MENEWRNWEIWNRRISLSCSIISVYIVGRKITRFYLKPRDANNTIILLQSVQLSTLFSILYCIFPSFSFILFSSFLLLFFCHDSFIPNNDVTRKRLTTTLYTLYSYILRLFWGFPTLVEGCLSIHSTRIPPFKFRPKYLRT